MGKSCRWLIGLLLIFILITGLVGYKIAYRHKGAIKCLFDTSCVKMMDNQEDYLGILLKDKSDNLMLIDKKDNTVSQIILHHKIWEQHITNILNKVVKPSYKVVSIGAHIGYHVVQISKLVGDQGVVYCFEPNPDTLLFLKANLALNDAKNVILSEKAIYSENTTLKFATYNENSNSGGSHVLLKGHKVQNGGTEIEVEAVTLDTALSDVDKIDVIQMDIEGSEPNAIKGAKKLIERSGNLIVIQEWSPTMMASHSDVAEYIKFWRDLGYKFARILEHELQEMTDQELLAVDDLIDVVITKDLDSLQKTYLSN